MDLKYDRKISIAEGTSRKSINWIAKSLTISKFYERLKKVTIGNETISEYINMSKNEQDKLKDIGGFVAGKLSGLRRTSGSVISRDAITLDLDHAETTEEVIKQLESFDVSFCVYSTRKHTPEKPRLRVIVPTDRSVSAIEYEAISRRIAENINFDWCDATTFEAHRLMYWPSMCKDAERIFEYRDHPLLSADSILKTYEDWTNSSSWPGSEGESKALDAKQADPLSKTGIIGAFCRTYDIHDVITEFLSDVYELSSSENRYTYILAESSAGVVIYENGKFAYSNHATDPAHGKLYNAFDLVRIHKFGHLDKGARYDTPTYKLPSYIEMDKFSHDLADVEELYQKERADEIASAFDDEVSEDAKDFFSKLKGQIVYASTIEKALDVSGINIALNEITGEAEIIGQPKEWLLGDTLDLLPIWLFEIFRKAGSRTTSIEYISNALRLILQTRRYNPVIDMLNSAKWDDFDRISEYYQIIGVNDDLSKTLIRKWCIQSVAMAHNNYHDPYGADGVLVFQGKQGVGKTSALREIMPKFPGSFKEGVSLDTKDKDSVMQATKYWNVELGEIESTTKRDAGSLKAFLTKNEDEYRPPYGRNSTKRPRRTSFCGSVNNSDYLIDETGNRRLWTVTIHNVDKARLFSLSEEWRIQLWAQIYHLYQENPQGYRLTDSERAELEKRNTQFSSHLKYELEVRELFDYTLPVENWFEFSANQVYKLINPFSTTGEARLIGRVLAKLANENPLIKKRIHNGLAKYTLPILKSYQDDVF